MRATYNATGRELFGVLRSVAYGLRRPTVETVRCNGQTVLVQIHGDSSSRRLPTGQKRDSQLQAIADRLRQELGLAAYQRQGWQISGRFDYSPRYPPDTLWLVENAIPHAESFNVALSLPALDEYLAGGGEQTLQAYRERQKRRSGPLYLPPSAPAKLPLPSQIPTDPVLEMLTQGQLERYYPRIPRHEYGVSS